jgi:hypothetical protein
VNSKDPPWVLPFCVALCRQRSHLGEVGKWNALPNHKWGPCMRGWDSLAILLQHRLHWLSGIGGFIHSSVVSTCILGWHQHCQCDFFISGRRGDSWWHCYWMIWDMPAVWETLPADSALRSCSCYCSILALTLQPLVHIRWMDIFGAATKQALAICFLVHSTEQELNWTRAIIFEQLPDDCLPQATI